MDQPSRRAFGKGLLTALAGTTMPLLARSQSSTQPGRVLVGYPAGGTLDQTARRFSDAWRQQGRAYIVDNRAGAAGRVANAQLKRERADGSVVLCTHTSSLTIYPHVYSNLAYDSTNDFTPVTPVCEAVCAFAVSSMAPQSVTSLAEFVRWAKEAPHKAMYASPAAGSVAHFLGFRFSQAAGLNLQHVPYRGSAPALQDLLGGQIASYFGFVGDFLPYLATGKLRILGTTGQQRSRFLPKVATFAEQGLAGVEGAETYGLFLPPKASDSTVNALYEATKVASQTSVVKAGFDQIGMDPITLSPREFVQRLAKERERWRPIVKASGFTSQQ
ncbi:tripartite tricarboxylate transporter substrate-binding protein [Azohydromonas australica]|uniref:tripartite tricarboxylate transporter substrate-binding protein n=1 Tax=Azohydromonas australica TaxID=364039 RepID=UPI000414E91B|nr:tripartite tricarboxylate transporter substrate-binding protein [Azohydromonas australica]